LLGEEKKLEVINYGEFVRDAARNFSKSTARNGSEAGKVH